MQTTHSILLTTLILVFTIAILTTLLHRDSTMPSSISLSALSLSLSLFPLFEPLAAQNTTVDLSWYPPRKSWINNLSLVINTTGTHGFIFNTSHPPSDIPYGTYNWCNMPHVRADEYVVPDAEYALQYVEVIHRHHKRTPYASNTFPHEPYPWDCSDTSLFTYAQPLPSNNASHAPAHTYWTLYTSPSNPFARSGFNGICQFPQLTSEGLEDSWQHGKDLYKVYHELLQFLPEVLDETVVFRVTNNVITSQVAGMLIRGMYTPQPPLSSVNTPLHIQPPTLDSLEPTYPCSAASHLSATYGVGSSSPNWTHHLTLTTPLFAALDSISNIPPTDTAWHNSLDHYFDNLSARQCHSKPLPCALSNASLCITQDLADAVYILGQYEYSFLYRDAPESLSASTASYGVYLAELAQNLRDSIDGAGKVLYRHNIAHDGSIARLLSILQVDMMVWPGMGSEVIFELYARKGREGKWYLRILWGGQVLWSSNPTLGLVDMLDVDVFLAYIDGLVGRGASKVVELCRS